MAKRFSKQWGPELIDGYVRLIARLECGQITSTEARRLRQPFDEEAAIFFATARLGTSILLQQLVLTGLINNPPALIATNKKEEAPQMGSHPKILSTNGAGAARR
jgi:hypothetical protein